MTFPNDYLGVHKALTAGKHVSAASELGAGFRALAAAIRSDQPNQTAKPGLFDLLRSRKKSPAPSQRGVLAS
jgi:hypothetical protein